ncbi:glycoside hydrolase family 2 protein [Amycolatopsis sp. NPDC050768]|uniref:glycoside hydrolase family 2 protein n=1 Tax=Amycolatopsis sp. NPDC050768 TaxID=3154839 RepID=UPI0034025BA5
MRMDLTRWTVRATGDLGEVPAELVETLRAGVPATVPGSVHTDLLAAGLIPDPYLDRNEDLVQWIGLTDWRYETEFDRPDAPGAAALAFDGLDTVAKIELNGRVLGETENMHRSYRFPAGELRPEGNELSVTFASAVRYARARAEAHPLPRTNDGEPSNFIRKMACNFGWDWGPSLVTAGLWRPARLEVTTGRLASVRPVITVDGTDGVVTVHTEVEGEGTVRIRVAGVEAAGDTARVPSPELWWPHTLGEQPLYPLEVTLEAADGTVLDTWTREIGFRTVALDTTDGAFTLSVNGTPLFVRGANWIPDDCFPHRVDAQRYARRIEQAKDVNIDLLRVWGGGIFESDEFYAECDREGVLVWQDFLFACMPYPEDVLADEVEAEARENVVRLAPHPSLVLWCGNNENYLGWFHWDWQERLAGQPWGATFYEKLLPTVVGELDPTRPYVPGSPWALSPERDALDPDYGCQHVWDMWNERDYLGYRDTVPRFVSEFGWQAPPTFATLTEAVHDEPLAADSPGVLHHQKAFDGNGKLARGLAPHFAEPKTFDDWHFLNQVNQARAIRLAVEHYRSHAPRCMGAIVWQLNDCWPVTSWAAVDGAGRPKPLWYTLREVYADRLLTIQPRPEGLTVFALGFAPETVDVRRMSVTGEELASAPVAPGTALGPEFAAGDPAREFLVADAGDERAFWFFAEDKDIAYPQAEFTQSVTGFDGGYEVTVIADTLMRDVCLFPDRLAADATVDFALVTLLPGESATFTIETGATLQPGALTSAPVLRWIE